MMLISIENTRDKEWHTISSHLCEWLDLSFSTIRDFQEPLNGTLTEQIRQIEQRQERWERLSDCVIITNYQYPHLLIHHSIKEVNSLIRRTKIKQPTMSMILVHQDDPPEISQSIHELLSRRNMKFPTRMLNSVGKEEVWEQFKALSETLAHRLG